MLITSPPKSRRYARPKEPAALVLKQANYTSGIGFVILQFDRAVSTARLNGALIRIDDGPGEHWYTASETINVLQPSILQIFLERGGSTTGANVTLTATGGNGIFAQNDGGAWAGVDSAVLPFG